MKITFKNIPVYQKLALSSLISFIIMFFIMYAMIDTYEHLYININKFYMALLMITPMIIIKILSMPEMFKNKKINISIISTCILTIIISITAIRYQSFVDDKEFLRAMIPHHSSAILMCDEANISDAEINELCNSIITAQKSEIKQMEQILKRY